MLRNMAMTQNNFLDFLARCCMFCKTESDKEVCVWDKQGPTVIASAENLLSTLPTMLEAPKLYSKQRDSSTCAELRLQCSHEFIGAEATPESQMCWP